MTDEATPETSKAGDGPVLDTAAFMAGNEAWTREFAFGGLKVQPRRRMCVLTCMDSRFTAQGVIGLGLGDVHVLRNAGGRVTDDMVRSLVLSSHALGTRGCVVIHHTNCGLSNTSNETIRAQVAAATGEDASGIDFLPFDDYAGSVREDMARLRACRLLPAGYEVLGFVYDTATGHLTLVEE